MPKTTTNKNKIALSSKPGLLNSHGKLPINKSSARGDAYNLNE